mgnify:CR=1 FL=1
MRTVGKLLLTASLMVAAAGVAGPTKASLLSNEVTLTCSQNIKFTCGYTEKTGWPNATVGTDVEFTLSVFDIPVFEIDLDASSISMTHVQNGELRSSGPSTFTLTDLNWVGQTGKITGATISTSDADLGKSFDYSFTDDSFTFSFSGGEPDEVTRWGPGGSITANLSGSATDVPIPATLGLLVTGLVGMGLLARRRRDI